jgi:hypothetical protein
MIRFGHQHPFDAAAFIRSTAVSNVNREKLGIAPELYPSFCGTELRHYDRPNIRRAGRSFAN